MEELHLKRDPLKEGGTLANTFTALQPNWIIWQMFLCQRVGRSKHYTTVFGEIKFLPGHFVPFGYFISEIFQWQDGLGTSPLAPAQPTAV